MEITKITYKKLFSLENYENEQIGIEFEIENDTPEIALQKAKEWVNKNSTSKNIRNALNKANDILDDWTNHSMEEIQEANKLIKEDCLPF